ncbi:MAG: RnfABCDGE type electron transport complex subunit B [Flavobacteriales bacterium]|nr:RnfABCDGE type electron transport complex subunit B [Flavobacteriales bacterium]
MNILIALSFLGGLTLLLAFLIFIANRFLYVYEDPRIDKVNELLPQANCGACGYPGCRPFAEALVGGEVLPGKCTVSSEEGRMSIAQYLGVGLGNEEKKVARLACAGGKNVATKKANYWGLETCQAAALVSGGGKSCFWGCLGFGDCERVCDFDAISMDRFGIPLVDASKCTACGDCVDVCPKDLFSLQPLSNRLWVACKNLEKGEAVLEECEVGCTACGKCAMDAPQLIEMKNNLPVIEYGKGPQKPEAIDRCPTGSIVWWAEDSQFVKGKESKKVIRVGER